MSSVSSPRCASGILQCSAVIVFALGLLVLAPAGVDAAPYPPIPSTPAVSTIVAPPPVRVNPPATTAQNDGTIQFSVLQAGAYPVQAATGSPPIAETPAATGSVIAAAVFAAVLFALGRRRCRACA